MGFNTIMMALSNDYTDRKSIRTEKTKVDVIPKTALEQWAEERFAPTVFSIKEMFVEGDTYLVTTDSGTFTAVCKRKLVEGIDMALLGNGNKYDLEDTGESFGVATILYPGQGVIGMAFDYNNGAFIEVSKVVETIDPKFLPGPVVLDLTKYDANDQSLNDLVLSLFMSGGGKTSVNNTDGTQAFWKDVNTDGRIQLMIDANSVKLVSDVKSTTLEPDGTTIIAIETSFLIIPVENTSRVTVVLGAVNDTTEITLVVEFLTIPG